MKVCVIASGSKGNVTYIETKSHRILLDMGKNKKYIVNALKSINVDPETIDYILISHLHADHISALQTFISKYKPTLCLTEEMVHELNDISMYEKLKIYDDEIELGNLKIIALKSSHDATSPRNFIIEEDGHSVVQITDTGYLKSKYFGILKNRDVYLLESNHDIEMLTHGPYPDWLKNRVLSDVGHLSNQAAGFYLSKLVGTRTKYIYLMHLSEVNNNSEVALKTVNNVLNEYNVKFSNIKCAKQDEISEVIEV